MSHLVLRGLGGTRLVTRGLGPASGTLPPDLVAAVLARLRDTPAVVAAFGESLPGARKFYSTPAAGRPRLPYLVVDEGDSAEEPESAAADGSVAYVAHGGLTVSVYAAGKLAGRRLRALVMAALDDAPLDNAECDVLYFRHASPTYPPEAMTAPGAPLCYAARVRFDTVTESTSTPTPTP